MASKIPVNTKGGITPVSRKSFARFPQVLEVPSLIKVQLDSFRWFQEEGLRQLFEEISPIEDSTGNRLEIKFVNYEFRKPRHTEEECRQRDLTYSVPLYVRAQLLIKETGEIKEYSDKMTNSIKNGIMSKQRTTLIAEYGHELLKKYPYKIYTKRIENIDPLNIQ